MVRAILDKLWMELSLVGYSGTSAMRKWRVSTTKDQMADKAGMWLQRSRVRQSENYQLPEFSSTKSI